MKKIAFGALLLTFLPGVALSQEFCDGNHQQAMSCAEGKVWDEASGSCVTVTS